MIVSLSAVTQLILVDSVMSLITIYNSISQNKIKSGCHTIVANQGDSIIYTNGENYTALTIQNVEFINGTRGNLVTDCDEPNKSSFWCYNSESARVNLHSNLLHGDFSIRLSLEIENAYDEESKQGSTITIRSGLTYQYLYVPVEFGTLQNPHTYKKDFHESIEFLGKTFYNVWTSEPTGSLITNGAERMYYNKEYGLVAFEHESRIWRINI